MDISNTKFLTALALTLSLLSPPIMALTLKVATLAPAGTTWMNEMKKGANEVKKRTSGRVKLKFYPGGVMGNDQSVHRKIRINQLQGGAFSASGMSKIDTSAQLLSLPMLFRDFAEVDQIRAKMDARIKKQVAENGFILLGITEGGFARIMSSKPIETLADLQASKVWIPEGDILVEETYKAMGISPIPLPISDVFTGLQTGLIETIAAPASGAIAFQWHSKLKYMVDLPVLYVIGMLAISDKAFSRIKEADQAVVIDEMNKVFARLDELNRRDNLAAYEALKNQGIIASPPSEATTKDFQQRSDQSINNMIDQGLIDRGLVEDIRTLLREIRKP